MAVEKDPRSMSSQTLAKAASDPDHPLHLQSKIELQRRRGEMQEIDLKTLTKKISNTGMKSTTKAMGADKLKKDLEAMKQKLQKEEKTFRSLRTEKTLTPAEKKKREEIAKAIEKGNPDMPMDKKMAIATATAKRVAEANDDQYHKTLAKTKNSDEGIEALKKKHGMSHDQAKKTLNRLMGEAEMSLYDKIKAARANPSPDKPVRGRGSKNRNPKTYDVRNTLDKEDDRLQGMVKKKLKKEEVEQIDEISVDKMLDYKQRAKYSRDRAANSQAAHSLRGTDPSKDIDTERKRKSGLKTFDKLAARKTRDMLTKKEVTDSDIANAGRSIPAPAGNKKAHMLAKATDSAKSKKDVSLKKAPWDEGKIK